MTLQKRERHSKLINSVYHEDLWEIIDEVNGQGEDIEEIIDGTLLTPSSLYPALQAAGYTNVSNQITTAAITPALEGYETSKGYAYADVSDVASDNIPAINAALQDMKAIGGGTVYLPTHKVFPIRPSMTNFIEIPSNCHLNLGDARLKVATDAPAYQQIVSGEGGPATLLDNASLTGGEIDGNPANHVNSDAAVNGQYVFLSWSATNLDIIGVSMISGGTNTVSVNGSGCKNIRVNDNTLTFVQAGSSTPNYDNSSVYVTALMFEVSNNRFYTTIADKARGCLELHGPIAHAVGNQSWNFYTLANITVASNAPLAGYDSYVINVTDNEGFGLRQGITFWPQSVGEYRNIGVTNNRLYISQIEHDCISFHGIAWDYGVSSAGVVDGFDISHNTIVFEEGDSRAAPTTGAFAYSACQAIMTGGIGTAKNGIISHNTVLHAPMNGMQIGNSAGGTSEHQNVTVEGNLLVNPGCNRTLENWKRVAWKLVAKHVNTRISGNTTVVTGADGTSADPIYLYVHKAGTSGSSGSVFIENDVIVNGGHTLSETLDETLFATRRAAAATTLGSVVKKQEVFDQYGASLGFVPIYDAIT